MKTSKALLFSALLSTTCLTPEPAHAGPVVAFVSPIIGGIQAAWAGFAATGLGTFLTTTFVGQTLVSIGLSYAANALTRSQTPDVRAPNPSDNLVNYAQPVTYFERVYGRVRKGGPIAFTGFNSGKRHYCVIIASHSTKGPFQHYLDERSINVSSVTGNVLNTVIGQWNYGNIRAYTGQPGQVADQVLKNNFPGEWTDEHDMAGLSYAAIWAQRPKPERFSKVYPNGREWAYTPVWEGCDTIYDPRDKQTKYTANAALVIADWIVNVLGEEVDWDKVAEEANVCDEQGFNRAGNPINKWRINGTLNESADIETQRSMLAMSCDAFFYENRDGKIGFNVGRWIEPSVTLTDEDFLSLTVSSGGWGDQSPSEIVVQYVEPSIGWRESPSAAWKIDGRGELNREVKPCHMVTNHTQAMRLAKRFSRIERAEYRIQGTLRLAGYEVMGQRFVRIRSESFGKEFYAEIDTLRRAEDGITFEVEARSVLPSDFDFNGLTEEPERPDYNTPTSNDEIEDVTNITVVRQSGYESPTYLVRWDEQDETLTQQVQFRQMGTSAWTVLDVPSDQNSQILTSLLSGVEYQVQVRNRTGSGRTGSWSPVPPISFVAGSTPSGVFVWDDVFADHSDRPGGADWTDWGTSTDKPAEVPLEFFMRSVLPDVRPDGAEIFLESPTGVMHLRDRMQPPPRSILRNWTLDLSDTLIERGKSGTFWGQFHLWGEVVEEQISGLPTVGVDAFAGDTELTLTNDAAAAAFLAAAGPGSIAIVRTNKTAPDYHPPESRELIYISAVSGNTLTLARPLSIDVPVENPPLPGETEDPSTVTLLQGSILERNAPEGARQVTLVNANGIVPGDWVYLSTAEIPTPDGNQFAGTLGLLLDPNQPFGDILINEEVHRVIAVSGNTLTLAEPLGKNKLTAWNAACVKIDPIEGATLRGGRFEGQEQSNGAEAWEHQYVWSRYCVGCTISDAQFDKQGRPLSHRRIGQAVRMDTGADNLVTRLTIGQGGSILAGEGYGVSLRRGERETIVSHSDMEKCRHSVELWSTTAGCVVEYNTVRNDTSSSLDTHGSWNKGVIIRHNVVSNDGALLSPDLGGMPDAIRIGNNRFWLDEDIQVYDNIVTGYRGVAVAVVPGSRRVTVDGLICNDVDRVLQITRNVRHHNIFSEDVIVRNVTANDVRDRICEVSHASGNKVVKGLTLENWLIGNNGLGTADLPGILNLRLLWIDDLVLDGVRLEAISTQQFHYAWHFEDVDGLTMKDCFQQGGERGIRATRTSGINGTVTMLGLTANTAHVFRQIGSCEGELNVIHDDTYTPVVDSEDVVVTLIPA